MGREGHFGGTCMQYENWIDHWHDRREGHNARKASRTSALS